MVAQELFEIGNSFYNEGRSETAMDIWNRISAKEPNFGPVYINQHNVYRAQGNLVKARECLIKFLNCPVTGMSVDAIPAIKAQLQQLEQQLNPQPQQPPQPIPIK